MNSLKYIVLCAICNFSCQHKSRELSPIDKAEQLINERQFTEAILILEKNASEDSTGRQNLLLSSAYAGSAGVNLIDSYSFFSGFLTDSKGSTNKVKKSSSTSTQNKDKLLALSQTIQAYLMTLASDSQLLLSIPLLSSENRSKLNEAILTASKSTQDQEYYARARQYLVFLNLIQFGNYMKDVFPKIDFTSAVTSVDLVCGLEPQFFVLSFEYAINSFSSAIGALDDLQQVKPLKIKSQIEDLKSIVNSLQGQLTELRPNLGQVTMMISSMQQGYCS